MTSGKNKKDKPTQSHVDVPNDIFKQYENFKYQHDDYMRQYQLQHEMLIKRIGEFMNNYHVNKLNENIMAKQKKKNELDAELNELHTIINYGMFINGIITLHNNRSISAIIKELTGLIKNQYENITTSYETHNTMLKQQQAHYSKLQHHTDRPKKR